MRFVYLYVLLVLASYAHGVIINEGQNVPPPDFGDMDRLLKR